MDRSFWVNGEWHDGCSDEHISMAFASVYGRGARIVLPVVSGRIRFLERSLAHLEMAVNAFGLHCPDIAIDLGLWAITAATENRYQLELCIGITGPVEEQHKCSVVHLASLAPWNPPSIQGSPVRAVSSPWVRLSMTPLAGICNISGLERYKLLSYANSQRCHDGLWINEHGYVVEFTSNSLLWFAGDSWIRPSADLNPTWNPVMDQISETLEITRMKARIDELCSARAIISVSSFGTFSIVTSVDHLELPPPSFSVDLLEQILTDQIFH
jgi:branched-subunit amino acid aminotransferase/4-amino-4-deoxychorismate lyase